MNNSMKKMQSPGYAQSKTNKIRVVIKAAVWEWYGTETAIGVAGEGRYKAKGCAEFVTWVPSDMYWYNTEQIMDAFDKKMYVNGEFFMYSAQEVVKHYVPEEVELDFD